MTTTYHTHYVIGTLLEMPDEKLAATITEPTDMDQARAELRQLKQQGRLYLVVGDCNNPRADGSCGGHLKPHQVPAGLALVPREITAETGHKKGMLGDFHETIEQGCPECMECEGQSDCEICGGRGVYLQRVPIEWSTIKAIHRRMVELSEQGGQG